MVQLQIEAVNEENCPVEALRTKSVVRFENDANLGALAKDILVENPMSKMSTSGLLKHSDSGRWTEET